MRVCYVSLEDPEEANLLEDYKIGQTAYGLNKYLGMQGPVVGFNTVTKELIVHFEDHGFSAPTSLNREQVSTTAPPPSAGGASRMSNTDTDDQKTEESSSTAGGAPLTAPRPDAFNAPQGYCPDRGSSPGSVGYNFGDAFATASAMTKAKPKSARANTGPSPSDAAPPANTFGSTN